MYHILFYQLYRNIQHLICCYLGFFGKTLESSTRGLDGKWRRIGKTLTAIAPEKTASVSLRIAGSARTT
jgi:hypothetical protein